MSPVDRFVICPVTNMEVASIKILEWPEGRSLHRPAGGDTRRAPRQDGSALGRCLRRWRFERTISGLPHRSRLLLPQERQAHLLEGFCQLISTKVCLKKLWSEIEFPGGSWPTWAGRTAMPAVTCTDSPPEGSGKLFTALVPNLQSPFSVVLRRPLTENRNSLCSRYSLQKLCRGFHVSYRFVCSSKTAWFSVVLGRRGK
jgi:hypothetical protein